MSQEPITDKQETEEIPMPQEQLDQEAMKGDKCPFCLTPTANFPYLSGIPPLGWLECVFCGGIFCPKSVREMKLRQSAKGIVTPVPRIIIP